MMKIRSYTFIKECFSIAVIQLTIFIHADAQAPLFRFEHLTTEDGLANNSINDIYQDRHGFMWIATWDGLSRYDGYVFETFQPISSDSGSINKANVLKIAEDRKGNLWVSNRNKHLHNLLKYNASTKKFKKFFEEIGVSGIYGGLYKDKAGYLLISQKEPSLQMNKNEDTLFLVVEEGIINRARSIVEKEGKLWVGTSEGIFIFDQQQKNYFTTTTPLKLPEIEGKSITALAFGREDNLWIGTTDGLYCYNTKADKNTIQYFSHEPDHKSTLSDNRITFIFPDSKKQLWIGTMNGLHLFDETTKRWIRIRQNPLNIHSLNDNHILCITEDRSGNLWIGTNRGGVNKLHLYSKPFEAYNHITFKSAVNQTAVHHFAEENEKQLWIASSIGLFLFDRIDKKVIKRYELPKTKYLKTFDRALIPGFMSVCKDKTGKVWAGTRNIGIFQIDQLKDQLIPFTGNMSAHHKMRSNSNRKIYEDKNGNHWIAGGQILKIDKKTTAVSMYGNKVDEKSPFYFNDGYFWDIYQESECIFWIGGEKLNKLNVCDSSFQQYTHQFDHKHSLNQGNVLSIHDSHDGYLWIGLFGGGLNRFDKHEETFKHYTTQEGLPNNHIYGILEDDQENLWMSTNKGISKFNPKTETFRNYDVKDGIHHHEFCSGAFYKTKDGKMFFGGVNGFTSFYPDQIEDSPYRPQVQITEFSIFGKPQTFEKAVYEMDSITISSLQNHFEIAFAALDYTNPQNNLYTYQLKGYDKQWSTPSPLNRVKYTNLDPGTYTFQLKGSNSDAIFNPEPKTLTIIITPLYYQTTWFKFLLIGLALLTIYLIYYIRVRYLKIQQSLKLNHRIAELRTEALSAQMNHHFVFNAIHSIQRFITEKKTKEALHFSSQFAKLIRRVLQQSEKTYISLEEEIEFIRLYLSLEALRLKNKFEYHIQTASNIDVYITEIPAMFLQPHIENAIWHGLLPKKEKGKLWIKFTQEKQTLIIIIEDNGIGRKAAQTMKEKSAFQYESKGIEISKNRMDMLNQRYGHRLTVKIIDLYDQQQKPKGTRVVITLLLQE